MAREQVVVVHAEFVDVDVDLWCLDCTLSTGARVWFATTARGASTLRSALFCTECRGQRIQDC